MDISSIIASSNNEAFMPFLVGILAFYFGNILNHFNQKGGNIQNTNT